MLFRSDNTDRKRVKVVDQQFDSREEAMAYMMANAVQIVEANTTFGEADLPLPPDRARTGPERRTGNVTADDFKATFGFRGVQFGNWNNQDERQALMNDAWDGLMDLADVLGLPPKALGLNGDLALAFGARGHGLNSARAHYEPARTVINLTKEQGAGSLAHEWFHAMDNYFARLDRTGETKATRQDAYATDRRMTGGKVRPEVEAAFRNLAKVLNGGTFSQRSLKLDEARSKPYYSQTIEKAARGFERYIVDRLEGMEISNDYLVNIRKDDTPALPNREEMEGGITRAYDQLFNTLDTKETARGVMLYARTSRVLDDPRQMSMDFTLPGTGRRTAGGALTAAPSVAELVRDNGGAPFLLRAE